MQQSRSTLRAEFLADHDMECRTTLGDSRQLANC